MPVAKVTGYQASDGKFFKNKSEADEYQQEIDIERALIEIRMDWLDDHDVDAKHRCHVPDEDMLKWLNKHKGVLHRLLHILDQQ